MRSIAAVRPSPGPPRPTVADGALAVAALAASLVLVRHGGILAAPRWSGRIDPAAAVLAAGSTLPLLGWRRFPLGTFVSTTASGVLLAGFGYPADVVIGPTAALYLLAATRSSWSVPTVVVVAGLFAAYLAAAAVARQAFPGVELLHTGLAFSGAWFAGERTRLRREQIAALRARARRAEQDAERERQLAVAEERARIARDLHDSAGHAISVIAVRAGAARLHHRRDPQRSLAAMAAVEQLARQTAEQIDQIVGSLRDPPADGTIESPAGLASLDTLIAQHTAAGLAVTLDRSGPPPPNPGGPADQASYRILQEALTNAARHGTGSARVTVAASDTSVDITVTNPTRRDHQPRPRGGHGLIGMRERLVMLGGSLHTSAAGGRFRLQASIPTTTSGTGRRP